MPQALSIRKAETADLPAVARIERGQFSHPWSLAYYAAELTNPLSHFYVAEDTASGSVVGYLLFWRLDGELELHKIAVDAPRQRQGHASRLLEFFIHCGRSWNCQRALLEVRAGNAPAIQLYEKFSFHSVGRRHDYYSQPVEDALVYELIFREAAREFKKSRVPA
jgi:ribosomal-protein-alanine N-acetyltransferase